MINVKSHAILNEFIGGSEKKMKALFDVASDESRASRQPSIIFFDEFDALCGSPGRNDSKVDANINAQLLTFMQGIEPPKGEIVIIGATNHPKKLPLALQSRFRKIYVGLPANADELRDILKLHVEKRDKDRDNVLTDGDYRMLSNTLFDEEASGRDVEEIVKKAIGIVRMQTLKAKFWRQDIKNDLWVPCGEDISERRADLAEMRATYGNDKLSMPSLSVDHFTEAIEKSRAI